MNQDFDAVVIGGGIAGLQSASDLADQGFEVLLVEKGPSIGGNMILLSKVFPTLDCSSCITTPKMSYANNHENVTIWTLSEVETHEKDGVIHKMKVRRKARYVDETTCKGCGKCEQACPIVREDPFDFDLGSTKAIHIPFKNAIPQIAVLNMDHCIKCGACERACPVDGCIDYLAEDDIYDVTAKAVVLATGYDLTPIDAKKEYNADELTNVLSPLQFERLLAPHGPYGGQLRPSDGKVIDNLAFVQCAGSRDETLGVPYCSRVCCMYAIKMAMLFSGAQPLADISVYYMDIRAFGKGYDQFYQNAKAMGVNFIKGKVAQINAAEDDGNVIVRVEEIGGDGGVREFEHDTVVLSLGLVPAKNNIGPLNLPLGTDGFVTSPNPKLNMTTTNADGIFVAGAAVGPKDIVDSIVEASASAMQASAYISGGEE